MESMRKKFTLIELLVVIAIMAILAGLLMSALGQARERGRSTACLNNQKNLMLAVTLYADEYGFFPTQCQPRTMWANYTYVGWKAQIAPYLGVNPGQPPGTQADANARPQFGNGIFRCLSWRNDGRVVVGESMIAFAGGVGYNGGDDDDDDDDDDDHDETGLGFAIPIKPAAIRKPSETIATGDNSDRVRRVQFAAILQYEEDDDDDDGDDDDDDDEAGGIGQRHRQGINIGWVDGHASWMRRNDIRAGKKSPLIEDDETSEYYYRRVK